MDSVRVHRRRHRDEDVEAEVPQVPQVPHHHRKKSKKEKKKKKKKSRRRSAKSESEAETDVTDDGNAESTPERPDDATPPRQIPLTQRFSTTLEKQPEMEFPEVIDVDAIPEPETQKHHEKPRKSGQKSGNREDFIEKRDKSRKSERKTPKSPVSLSEHVEKTANPSEHGEKMSKSDKKSVKMKETPSDKVENPETVIPSFDSQSQESLSIEETNKLRISIGLAPLKINSQENKPEEDENHEFAEYEKISSSSIGERHKPAENLTQKSKAERIKAKLAERREKRKQESRFHRVKGLGESDDEEDSAHNWVKRQKKTVENKKAAAEAAAKRARMLADMDREIEEQSNTKAYGGRDLAGLTIEHSSDRFTEGRDVILTLKDADILDEQHGDTLINVNIVDDERNKRNLENAKKAKTGGYNPYDNESVDEVTGEVTKKNLLDKYDEEIDGEAKTSFVIGKGGNFNEEDEIRKKKELIREKLKNKNVVSLSLPDKKVASDYYTKDEVVAFKKPKKKKKKLKKTLRADELLTTAPEDSNLTGSRTKKEVIPDLTDIKVSNPDDEILSKAQKLKDKIKNKLSKNKKVDIAKMILKDERQDSEETNGAELIGTFADDLASTIVLNETSEFACNLGARQTSFDAGEKMESDDVLDDFEESLKSGSTRRHEERWREDSDDDIMEVEPETSSTILDEEPNLHQGVGAAIQMAMNKGYWEMDKKIDRGNNLKHLESKNARIEDKSGGDDRRHHRGDRYGGPTVPFQEKSDYVPNVKLEYMDDNGRKLNTKEAFRFLSHKFHGKGSGKIKSEKRMKKVMEDSMMKNMSSTDTPLGTVEKMKKKQKESSTPYLVLTGKNQTTDVRK